MFKSISKKEGLTILLMLLALIPIAFMPFQDTSEPRYAEIARLMYSTGDWITPWFEPGKPFWGKPPFSFWAAAASMHVFGVNEFAARFPAWLSMCLSLLLIRSSVARVYGLSVAQWSILIYVSMVLVFINIGAVLTDPFLALGTCLVLCSFLVCMNPQDLVHSQSSGNKRLSLRAWGMLGFIGLALGLLAKGPLVFVLVGIPIFCYLTLYKARWTRFADVYPWRSGIMVVLALVLPWYILAEIKTPGFLNYFIVGEHFWRFVGAGWQGDLYGTAHQQAYGTIWLNALVATLPWWPMVAVVSYFLWRQGELGSVWRHLKQSPLWVFVLTWALSCGVFFTFSGNILWTYLLPSMAGIALFFAQIMEASNKPRLKENAPYLALLMPSLLVLAVLVGSFFPNLWRTEKSLVAYVQAQEPASLYYYKERPFSARFYSAEKVQRIDEAALQSKELVNHPWFIAVKKDALDQFEVYRPQSAHKVFENKRYVLFKNDAPT